jgi:hypothetical protein
MSNKGAGPGDFDATDGGKEPLACPFGRPSPSGPAEAGPAMRNRAYRTHWKVRSQRVLVKKLGKTEIMSQPFPSMERWGS